MPVTATLSDLHTAWSQPYLDDSDAGLAARRVQTRQLAAAILAAPVGDASGRTKIGDLQISRAGWSRERGDLADAAGAPGSPAWLEALGVHEDVTLTADGLGVNRATWCDCEWPDTSCLKWIRYEQWTADGRTAHGYACQTCRKVTQTG